MATHTHLRPSTTIERELGHNEPRVPVLWPVVLLVAMALAALGGLAVAAQVTAPPAPAPQVASPAPNANEREGRVPTPTLPPPNANERESRLPTPPVPPPNANERESRIPSSLGRPCGGDPVRPGLGATGAILGAAYRCEFGSASWRHGG